MATSAVLRYNMNKITCYLDHARVAKCSASSGFNSVVIGRWHNLVYITVGYNKGKGVVFSRRLLSRHIRAPALLSLLSFLATFQCQTPEADV